MEKEHDRWAMGRCGGRDPVHVIEVMAEVAASTVDGYTRYVFVCLIIDDSGDDDDDGGLLWVTLLDRCYCCCTIILCILLLIFFFSVSRLFGIFFYIYSLQLILHLFRLIYLLV